MLLLSKFLPIIAYMRRHNITSFLLAARGAWSSKKVAKYRSPGVLTISRYKFGDKKRILQRILKCDLLPKPTGNERRD